MEILGVFLILLSAISAFALVLKAAFEDINEDNAFVLGLLFIGCGLVTQWILPAARGGSGIFLLVVGALSGFLLFMKAISNTAQGFGGGVLFFMFLGCVAVGSLMVFVLRLVS
jgi:hypothetical protein